MSTTLGPQIIFIGAPGSGKGTQAMMLARETDLSHISTGDLLRKEMSEGSELGKRVEDIINKGGLVNDDVMVDLLAKNCSTLERQYIFDGFPRNVEQANLLEKRVLDGRKHLVIYFEVNDSVIIDRITNRRICKDCGEIFNLASTPTRVMGKCDSCGGELYHRKDDTSETVTERLRVFNGLATPLLSYYSEKGVLRKIDATLPSKEVFNKVLALIGKKS